MRGKWAAGIAPRNFTWVIKDRLAVSERPGGFAPNHRKVRRQEEIIWLRVQGFTNVISLLNSSHNLAAYDDEGIASSHYPIPLGRRPSPDSRPTVTKNWRPSFRPGSKILVHQEELGDRVMGVVAGFLLWSGRLSSGPQATALTERVVGHQMGAIGRELVMVVGGMPPQSTVLMDGSEEARLGRGNRIEIRSLRVVAVCGVLPEERERPQPLEIDLDLTVDLASASASDDLADTVDYGT